MGEPSSTPRAGKCGLEELKPGGREGGGAELNPKGREVGGQEGTEAPGRGTMLPNRDSGDKSKERAR